MQDQLNRIEKKLDDALIQTTTNATDIVWIKWIVGGVGGLIGLACTYLFRKIG